MQLQAPTANIDRLGVVVAPASQQQPARAARARTQTQTAPAGDGLADSGAHCGAGRLSQSGFGRPRAQAAGSGSTRSAGGSSGAAGRLLLLVAAGGDGDDCLRTSAASDSARHSACESTSCSRSRQLGAAAAAGHVNGGYDDEADADTSASDCSTGTCGGDVRLVASGHQDESTQSAYWRRRRQRAVGASNATTQTQAAAIAANQFNTCRARCGCPASLLRHKHSSACAEQWQQQQRQQRQRQMSWQRQPTARDEGCSSATNWCATNNTPDCALRWQTGNSRQTRLARNYDTKLSPPAATGKQDAPAQADNVGCCSRDSASGSSHNNNDNNSGAYDDDATAATANTSGSACDQNNPNAGHQDSSNPSANRSSRSHLNGASFSVLAPAAAAAAVVLVAVAKLNDSEGSASGQNEPRAEHAPRQGAHHFQAHSHPASAVAGTDAQQVVQIGRPEAQPSPIAKALRWPPTAGVPGSERRSEQEDDNDDDDDDQRFVVREESVAQEAPRTSEADSKSKTTNSCGRQRQTKQQRPEVVLELEARQLEQLGQLGQGQQRQHEELTSRAAMEILQQRALEDRLSSPRIYPNNTLLADLVKCHCNIANLWPQASHAAGLGGLMCAKRRFKGRHHKVKKSRYKFHMPEVLIRANVKLKPDEYDRALSVLTSDVRFRMHLLLYRRVQTIWLLLSTVLCILAPVVLANFELLVLAGALVAWLCLQALGAVVTTQFRRKLDQMLEKSVAQVNTFFMDHNLMLGVINVGSLISKARLVIPMLYFDTLQCREQIESIISIDSRKDADDTSDKHILDYSKIDLPLTKPDAAALAKSQLAKKIVLRYSQRWISYFDKRKLMFTDDRTRPRHLSTGKCLCQFIEEHFRNSEQQCEQAKHNQTTPSAIISPYANTKATLFINGKEQQQPQSPKQHQSTQQKLNKQKKHQKRPEGRARSQEAGSDREIPQNGQLPSLSRLVSRKESQEHLSIEMIANTAQKQKSNNHLQPNGFVANLWPQYYHQQQQQNLPEKEASHTTSPTVASQSTSSSAEVSLEMGNDLIGRSDDLVKKLRLLLELRKNELQGIDGSLFSAVLYKAPHQFSTILSYQANQHQNSSPEDQSRRASAAVDSDSPIKSSGGKKFFNQREGLFFLGSGGGKKSQQQQAASTNQVLEIC